MSAGVRTAAAVPRRARARPQEHERPADRRRESQVVRREHDGDRSLLRQPSNERGDFELVLEIERRRRLVEEEQRRRALRCARRVVELRQRRRDDDALLFAAAQRREGPRRQIWPCRSSAGRPRRRDIRRALDLEGAEARIPAHQHDLEHRVVEREMRFLRNDGEPSREPAASGRPTPVRRRGRDASPGSGLSVPASSFRSVVLPEPFGPSMPTSAPRATAIETPSTTKRGIHERAAAASGAVEGR